MKIRILLCSLWALSAEAAPSPAPYHGHGAASVAPEVLARFAPKPLPSEVSRHIQAMLDVRAPGGGALSPDGKSLYFPWGVTGTTQLWKLDGPRRFPLQMTGGEDQTSLADITPDGKHLVVVRDRKGEENPGIYLQNPAGGPLEVIQHKPGVQTFYEFTSDDSKYIYFRSNDQKPDSYAIYRYDLAGKKIEPVFSEPGLWNIADHTNRGKLLLSKATGALSAEIFEFDGKLTPILGQGEKEEYDVAYGAHPGEILVQTNKLGDFRRLYKFVAGKLSPVTPEIPHDVAGFSIDDAKKHIYYIINDEGFTRARALDAVSYKDAPLPAFKEADHVTARPATHDGRFAVIGVETAQAPRRAYVYEWATKKVTEWVIPSAPEIDTSKFAVAKLEHYPARDGAKIPMLVRRPAKCETEACPVVVHFHGGPESQSVPGFAAQAQLFVDAGFIFAEPNVRGSDGYGKKWLHSDDGPKRLDVITDIEDAARYIRANWKVGKVGVYGGSYGGYSTLVAMTMFAGAYDAGVEIVGMSSLLTFLNNTAPYRRILRASEYGDPDKDKAALLKLSPVTYLDRLKAPLLMIQGASDPRVPVGEALQLQAALEARKVPAKLVVFPDEGHGAQKRDNRVIQIGESIAFFQKYL
jgi:dipeptidyl aminopeptidase/acylaminoacyl peptidase